MAPFWTERRERRAGSEALTGKKPDGMAFGKKAWKLSYLPGCRPWAQIRDGWETFPPDSVSPPELTMEEEEERGTAGGPGEESRPVL